MLRAGAPTCATFFMVDFHRVLILSACFGLADSSPLAAALPALEAAARASAAAGMLIEQSHS